MTNVISAKNFDKLTKTTNMDQTIVVHSTHGQLVVDLYTGDVIGTAINDKDDDQYFPLIVKVDLEEFKKYYSTIFDYSKNWEGNCPKDIDILDLGLWYQDGTYEEPVEDWRKEFGINHHLNS